MNREIKFRGKDIQSGEWRYGYVEYNYDKSMARIVSPLHIDMDSFPSQFFKVDIGTISQFTGLLDKNGNEIYEGDILMCIGQREDNKGRKYIRNVLFTNGAFGMKLPEWKCVSCLCNHIVNGKINWEIVGNIFDNSELIDG